MNRSGFRLTAFGTSLALSLQVVLPPALLAHDFSIPGGTTPSQPPSPSGGQPPAQNPCHEDPATCGEWDPVDMHRGDYILRRQDVLTPGRGLSVDISFTYRSRSIYNSQFGYGWDMSYNKRVRRLANGNVVVLRGNNRKDEFAFVGAGQPYTPPAGVYDTLVQNANGTCTLTTKHGVKEFYDINGNLTKIEDRNGNSLLFTYDPAGLLPITGQSAYFVNQTTGVIAREYRLIQIRMADPGGTPFGPAIDFAYNNADGRLASITYEGRTITYSYDPNQTGDLISVTNPLTYTTTYTYANHNLTTITDAKNQIYLTNAYDSSTDRLISQTYGTGTSTVSYILGASGVAYANVTDRKGFFTSYTFDSAGHITKMEQFSDGVPPGEPPVFVTQYQYDAAGNRTRIVYPRGNEIQMTYDAKGNLTEIRRKPIPSPGVPVPDLVTSFTYEPNYNFIKTITDPRGFVTTYTYDYELGEPNKGNLRRITFPTVGGVTPQTLFTYNAFGQIETLTDPNNTVTKYVYNPTTGYLEQITQGFGTPEAATTVLSYDAVGNVTSIRNPNSAITQFTYNDLNQLTKVTAPAPFLFETHYRYDANGNLQQVDRQAKHPNPGPLPSLGITDPYDGWQSTAYAYTMLDQLQTITDDLGHSTQLTYDFNGNRDSIQDANGNLTTYTFDERDLLWKVTDAATPAGITEYNYDLNGNLKEIKDANTNPTTYTYDDFDRLDFTTYVDTSKEDFGYDSASNLTGRCTVPAGQPTCLASTVITYTYDALNRLDLKTLPGPVTVDYVYDPGSRLTSVIDVNGTLSFTYDALNRVLSTTVYGLWTISYAYDGVGNRTRLTYPDNEVILSDYDPLNRLTAIRNPQSAIANFSYDALSRRTRLTLANGISTFYTYDAANRLTRLAPNGAMKTFGTFSYTYDSIGNRRTMTTSEGRERSTYTYDALSQLTVADYPSRFVLPDSRFRYDSVGNRLQVTTGSTTIPYGPNNLNQYATVGSLNFGYDLQGNLTNDTIRTYTYDAENQLITAQGSGLGAQYTYDAFGRRIQKTVNGQTTRFLYDGDQLIAETNQAGVITAKYLYGPGIDEVLRMTRGGTVSYYHADGLGSIIALTDSTGTPTLLSRYDIFGQPFLQIPNGKPVSPSGTAFAFTGREYDSETGLYFLRARYYSPTIGRFLQRDPLTWGPDDPRIFSAASLHNHLAWFVAQIEELRQIPLVLAEVTKRRILLRGGSYPVLHHLYSYVNNNPTNWIDPYGLWGIGPIISGSLEIGLLILGAGITGAFGGGVFGGGSNGINLGGFASFGAFARALGRQATYPTPCNTGIAGGAFAGVGVGGFITNATSVNQLVGPFNTYSFNLGAGPKLSFQFGISGSIWIFAVTAGPGVGVSGSGYSTNTWGTE